LNARTVTWVKEEGLSKPELTNRNKKTISIEIQTKNYYRSYYRTSTRQAYDFDWNNVKILNQEKC